MLGGALMRFVEWRIAARFWSRHFITSLNVGLAAAVFVVCYNLAYLPQVLELYAVELAHAGSRNGALACALAAAISFSWLLYTASRLLPRLFIFDEYSDRAPSWSQMVRENWSIVIAVSPWIAMAFGLMETQRMLKERATTLGDGSSPEGDAVLIGYALLALGATATLAGVFVWRRAHFVGRRGVSGASITWTLYIVVRVLTGLWASLAVLAIALLVLEPAFGVLSAVGQDVQSGLQQIGPIACVFLTLSALFGLVLFFLVFIPALLAPELVLPTILIALVYTSWSEASFTTIEADVETLEKIHPGYAQLPAEDAFDAWATRLLNDRGDQSAAAPVYIVAASGGGAYAAAHTAQALAMLQDENPRFAEHVFAVSGVSGGAVGASLFQAVDYAATDAAPAQFGRGPRSAALEQIVLGAHLGPLIAELPAVPATQLLGARADGQRDRAAVLRDTYVAATQSVTTPGVDGEAAARFLKSDFAAAWSPDAGRPALVLNTTGVEDGLTMAFAPFRFDAADGDDILRSYEERIEQLGPNGAAPAVQTLDAAIASARFPGVLPAFSPGVAPRRNYVDGGYADSSGATTARALYRMVCQRIAKSYQGRLEARLLLLVDVPNSDAADGQQGTSWLDTLAPFYAVLSVRSQQWRRNVQSAREEDCEGQEAATSGADADGDVLALHYNSVELALPLAWRLAPPTHDAIKRSLGDPTRCAGAASRKRKTPATVNEMFEGNSCALKEIISSLPQP